MKLNNCLIDVFSICREYLIVELIPNYVVLKFAGVKEKGFKVTDSNRIVSEDGEEIPIESVVSKGLMTKGIYYNLSQT